MPMPMLRRLRLAQWQRWRLQKRPSLLMMSDEGGHAIMKRRWQQATLRRHSGHVPLHLHMYSAPDAKRERDRQRQLHNWE